jgi:hypothetical protein
MKWYMRTGKTQMQIEMLAKSYERSTTRGSKKINIKILR